MYADEYADAEQDPYVLAMRERSERAGDQFDIVDRPMPSFGQRKLGVADYATSRNNRINFEYRKKGMLKKSRFTEEELDNQDDEIKAGQLYQDMKQIDDSQVTIDNFTGEFELIETFEDMALDPKLFANVKKRYVTRPSTIQRYAYPFIRDTPRNLICRAPTGSGKTASFLIPLIQNIIKNKKATKQGTNFNLPQVIIMSPTRELALQLAKDASILCQGTSVGVTFSIGEVVDDVRDRGQNGVDILIGTPGRLEAMFFQNATGKYSLSKAMYFVVDEADRLTSEYTFRAICERLRREMLKATNGRSRMLMYSATSDKDRDDELAANPVILKIGDEQLPVLSVVQKFVEVRRASTFYSEKEFTNSRRPTLYHPRDALHAILKGRRRLVDGKYRLDKTLVFVSRRRQADALAIDLLKAGYQATSTNGAIPMQVRNKTIEQFKRGEIDIIVCTNVLARGVNIPNVSLVINYNLPQAGLVYPTEYIHRLGRTGRMGNPGAAISFFNREKDVEFAKFLVKHLEKCGEPVPKFIKDCLNNEADTFQEEWVRNCRREAIKNDPDYIVPHRFVEDAEHITFI
ncbi:unnamed protein product [Bursaphelenchus okinawaensis]|uniref:RNA helicase n=1 Tax=Bursaphelenchus okinawaensis TaxID=465554 RepID=A0A811LAJ0_9BILA|nr:unnamed protein product [Bursaphelenchus okinawaensis]CAG9120563.1 unnamed protein product [Bursaphelenchus okinawaensis]